LDVDEQREKYKSQVQEEYGTVINPITGVVSDVMKQCINLNLEHDNVQKRSQQEQFTDTAALGDQGSYDGVVRAFAEELQDGTTAWAEIEHDEQQEGNIADVDEQKGTCTFEFDDDMGEKITIQTVNIDLILLKNLDRLAVSIGDDGELKTAVLEALTQEALASGAPLPSKNKTKTEQEFKDSIRRLKNLTGPIRSLLLKHFAGVLTFTVDLERTLDHELKSAVLEVLEREKVKMDEDEKRLRWTKVRTEQEFRDSIRRL
jgi:hypothetical protein